MGDYQLAISIVQGVCRSHPNRLPPYLTLVAALGQIGQIEKAQEVVQQVRRQIDECFLQPGWWSRYPEILPDHGAQLEEGFRKAGFGW